MCGRKLEVNPGEDPPTSEVSHPTQEIDYTSSLGDIAKIDLEINTPILGLLLIDEGIFIPMEVKEYISLGRTKTDTGHIPDVDLDAFDGFGKGVSRNHAMILINEHEIFISDLDSSNGTFVNKERLVPHEKFPLRHGDIITLGILKIQFLNYLKK
jgi:pSer/pThr/pTyr-binding forkhead associated (FHA) protein